MFMHSIKSLLNNNVDQQYTVYRIFQFLLDDSESELVPYKLFLMKN